MKKKRVLTMRIPKAGLVVRWGREETGADPDICAAWAPGSKQAAYTLLTLISDNRASLEAAGIDITTLKITAETTDRRGGKS
jgi:hypothetical protein